MDAALEEAFGDASPEHFKWQTENPAVAQRERELVNKAFLPLGQRVLDLGCGEGATLYHLGGPLGACGVDLFQAKIDYAQKVLPDCRFLRASVYELPFENHSFDHLLVRDLIHHLDEPERFRDECARVLSPGGRIDVLEPCRNNPLIMLHALTNRVERGELRSSARFLRVLFEPHFQMQSMRRYQALPIHRLVFHPKLGAPKCAHNERLRRVVFGAERIFEQLLPQRAWAYLHLRATLRD